MSLPSYGYPFKLVRKQFRKLESPQKGLFVYHFVTRHNYRYIVLVEEYENNILGLKYYYIGHRYSKNKYNLKTNRNDAFRILTTCIQIMYSLYSGNKKASFAFIGSNTIDLRNNMKEDIASTKRFSIYKKKVYNVFSPKKFVFYQDPNKSLFFIKNKREKNVIQEINSMVNLVYENIELIEC